MRSRPRSRASPTDGVRRSGSSASLAREAAALATAAGAAVLSGRAVATGAATPYRPLVEALAPWARGEGVELEAHRRALDALVPSTAGSPMDAVSPVFVAEALLRLLPHASGDGAAVLIIEDLHWADEETLAAVEDLADAAESLPLLVVVTARDDEGPASRRLLRALASRGALRLLPLGPLGPHAVCDLAELRLGAPVTPALRDLLVERVDGLPLFVEELLSALDASGRLLRTDDAVDAAPDARRVLPVTVADTVTARLDGLPDAQRTVIEAAALLGRSFDHDLLSTLLGDVTSALQAGAELRLLHEDPDRPGRMRFRHALLRDGVVVSTFPPRRVDLARRLLDLLLPRELTDDDLAVAIDLASRGGQTELAARLAVRRAMQSFDRWAMGSAETGLAEARRYAGSDPDLLVEIDVAQLRVASIVGRLDVVLRLGNSLLSRLDPARHGEELLETHLRLGQALLDEERWEEGEPHLQMAATLIEHGDDCHVTRLALWSSLAARLRGDVAAAIAGAVRAADLSRPHPDQCDLVCASLLNEGRAWLPDVETARARWQEALEYADAYGLRLWRARMMLELASLEADELRAKDIDDRLREADELARECGGVLTQARIALMQARLHLTRGELDAVSAATRPNVSGSPAPRPGGNTPSCPPRCRRCAATS